MKGFKKVLAVLLTVAMVGAMAVGCGSKGDDKKAEDKKTEDKAEDKKNDEALKGGDEEGCCSDRLDIKELFILAVATSIDALAVGITFAFLQVNIGCAAAVIGATTFVLSFVGVILGNKFGSRYKNKAELAGGVILIIMGAKILLEHLGIIINR